nr:unnamed protein product [Timema tahoe]
MEWMIINPLQVHSTFALGSQVGDFYVPSEDCLSEYATNYLYCLRERILVNLTLPVECLLRTDMLCKTDAGRITVFEVNHLLITCKEAFVNPRCTSRLVGYMRGILDKEDKLSPQECESIQNCLLLMRNVLHIPEKLSNGLTCTMQNQILWNLFSHSLDKALIHLMTCQQKVTLGYVSLVFEKAISCCFASLYCIHVFFCAQAYWAVTMVQVIALMYKDQRVGTLQKMLNQWFESSLSDSSEDEESNTSPSEQNSEASSLLTTDPTSDSSDNRGGPQNIKLVHCPAKINTDYKDSQSGPVVDNQLLARVMPSQSNPNKSGVKCPSKSQPGVSHSRRNSIGKRVRSSEEESGVSSFQSSTESKSGCSSKVNILRGQKRCLSSSELSDYGYGTQVENHEFISTSSNEDECLQMRLVHQKPHIIKKSRNKTDPGSKDKLELRRKKLVKRSRTNIVNMKALMHHVPTDEDVFHLMKEFTVDFLLKGYNCLVQELHRQLVTNQALVIDTSHFFWLITYFLKFTTQLELELEHVSGVLSYEMLSYLVYEGVFVCEQLEMFSKRQDGDMKPCLRRMHLAVTAIREFLQAVDVYNKMTHLSQEGKEAFVKLQLQMAATEDLRCLFVMLLHQFNPNCQSIQYLQDVIVTNHNLLLFLDRANKLPGFKSTSSFTEYIQQFATVEIMHQYGLLLENIQDNGEFINDCVFTMMHHIGGDVRQVSTLFQPSILKCFTRIWESDFELCDDWSDLIEYVILKFVNTPRQTAILPEIASMGKVEDSLSNNRNTEEQRSGKHIKREVGASGEWKQTIKNGGTRTCPIPVRGPVRADLDEVALAVGWLYEKYSTRITYGSPGRKPFCKNQREISALDDAAIEAGNNLRKAGKGHLIVWLQKVLIEVCYVKLRCSRTVVLSNDAAVIEPIPWVYTTGCKHPLLQSSLDKPILKYLQCSAPAQRVKEGTYKNIIKHSIEEKEQKEKNEREKAEELESLKEMEEEKKKLHAGAVQKTKSAMKNRTFSLLLYSLGFQLSTDSGKTFARIPNFWTPDFMFSMAEKLGPIDSSALKFDVNVLKKSDRGPGTADMCLLETTKTRDPTIFAMPRNKQTSPPIRFTPLPNSTPNWLNLVSQFKSAAVSMPPLTPSHHVSAEK